MTASVRLLAASSDEALPLIDPRLHLLAASRMQQPDAQVWGGYVADELQSLLVVGGNLYPVALNPDTAAAFASAVGLRQPGFASLVGVASDVMELWQQLAPSWPAAPRLIRPHQPYLLLDEPIQLPRDPRLRAIEDAELDAYTQAGANMFREELEAWPQLTAMRQRFANGIRSGHCFGWVEDRQVLFKCDLAAIRQGVGHVQGVWLHPRLRGQGLSLGLMAAALFEIQRLVPAVALYANDFNLAALALYRRLGFRQIGEYASVFV